MNRFKRFSTLVLFTATIFFGACSQDETMDELLENTEIGAPVNANETDPNGEAGQKKDPPPVDGTNG
ncbi:hypothetical protein [Marinoscillum pacificum]|uniref:hypothetical protein n=1 Tax=Marinoscillum pacificum TaxID=392723 RepID=UPI0021582F5E|nr:hypothetical protein [Marinoscillum pacificum]